MIRFHHKLLVCIFLSALFFLSHHPASAATFWVTSIEDSGTGSLREVIAASNTTTGTQTIAFAVSNSVVVYSPLNITAPVIITGAGTTVNSTGSEVFRLEAGSDYSMLQDLAIVNANDTDAAAIRISSYGNQVSGCSLGTNWDSEAGLGNYYGLVIESDANLIGGDRTLGRGNLVSGNEDAGIHLDYLASGNTLCGNTIGLNHSLTARLANKNNGILLNGGRNLIGFPQAGYENIIFTDFICGRGIYMDGNFCSHNTLQNNLIGITPADYAFETDIFISSAVNLIGTLDGDIQNKKNIITGGIYFSDASNNTVCGNYIGTNYEGTDHASDSTLFGIQFGNGNSKNYIGIPGTGRGNLIMATYNGISGIWDADYNSYFGNTICGFSNQAISHPAGCNNDKTAPVITFGNLSSVWGTADPNDFIELFVASQAEGLSGGSLSYIGSTSADGSGAWSMPNPGLPAGTVVTALATDPAYNTSVFALNKTIENATPSHTATVTLTTTSTPTRTTTPTLTPTATCTPTFTVTPTVTVTPSITLTSTITQTATTSPTVTLSPTITTTASITLSRTVSVTHTDTATQTPTVTKTATPTASLTRTPTSTLTDTATPSSTPTPTHTPVVWEPLNGSLNVDPLLPAAYPDLAIATDNTPYVVWLEGNTATARNIYVKHFNGTAWEADGTALTTSMNADAYVEPSIALLNNTPYVAYREDGQFHVKYFQGAAWQDIPAAIYPSYPSLLVSDNQLNCCYALSPELYVYYFSGSEWVAKGDEVTTLASGYYSSYAQDCNNGRQVVIWKTFDFLANDQLYAAYYDGSAWVQYGSRINLDPSAYIYEAAHTVASDQTPYVGWSESATLYVKRFNGIDWEQVGAALNGGLSSAYELSMDNHAATPYVAFQGWGSPSYRNQIYVKHFNGSNWEQDGDALNMDPNTDAYYPALAIADALVAAWTEAGQLYVKRFALPAAAATPTVPPTSPSTPTHETPSVTASITASPTPAENFDLYGRTVLAYPNPARTSVHFALRETGADQARITIYNINGECIAEIRQDQPGQIVTWDASAVAPGVYFYRGVLTIQGAEQQLGTHKLAIIQ